MTMAILLEKINLNLNPSSILPSNFLNHLSNTSFISSLSLSSLTITFLILSTTTLTYKGIKFIWREYITNPLNELNGPKSRSWLFGNMKEIWDAENSVVHESWSKKFGGVFKYKVFVGMSRLYTTDLKAINHVLMNSQVYYKPGVSRYFLSRVLGDGVLVVEGPQHREQRKIMNPAFGAAQIRELTEIFVEKSLELRDYWLNEIKESQSQETETKTNSRSEPESEPESEQARINVMSGLSKMTLDVIGLAGFNYSFNLLSGKKNELNEAFNVIFSTRPSMSLMMVVRGLLGRLSTLIPAPGDKAVKQARSTMDRIGKQLLEESKAGLVDEKENLKFRRRDLLSLLIKANMDKDVPESQRMSDEDVLAQVPTFLVAGHETTSNATTWALYALSLNKGIQTKLREELHTVATENPTMDELNALPYLDAVVRETLRVHAPVPSTMRVAMKDDVVPVGTPYVDKKGNLRDTILVRKGQTILIPILALNRAENIWGPDGKEFKPERWESIPEEASAIPGIWSNMLTFLGGPRACIGYRFTLVEMKALLFTLIRAFEFELAVPASEIGRKSSVVTRPILLSDPKQGVQMPLIVRPYVHIQ